MGKARLKESLHQFEELSGIPFKKIFDDSNSSLVRHEYKDLVLASKLDDGLLILGLNSYFQSYYNGKRFALKDFFDGSDVYTTIAKHKELKSNFDDLVKDESVSAQLDNIKSVIANLSDRNLTVDEATSINNDIWKTFVRGHSFIKDLKRRKVGNVNKNSILTPKFDRRIYFVESEKHVLDLVHHAKPGMYTIAVIDNDNPSACYFNLVIKTLDGAIIINDSEEKAYVESNRRTDRQNMSRIEKSLFPYSSFSLETTPSGKHLKFSEKSNGTSLATYDGINDPNSSIINIREIRELPFSEICELSVMYASIALDWTHFCDGETLVYGHEVLITDECTTLPILFKGSDKQYSIPKTPNRDDFYKASLDSSDYTKSLNTITNTDRNSYFEQLFVEEIEKVQITPNHLTLEYNGMKPSKNQITIPDDAVGSPEKIIADTVFNARMQQAKNLHAKINSQYENNFNDMVQWIVDNIDIDKLTKHACTASILPQPENCHEWMKTQTFGSKTSRYSVNTFFIKGKYTKSTPDKFKPGYPIFLNEFTENMKEPEMIDLLCVNRKNFANFFVQYTVMDAYDISYLTNTPIYELPYHMQEIGLDRYVGNSILDRIDPVERMHHRYIDGGKDFRLTLGFSLKGLNDARERNGHKKLSRQEAQELFKREF